MKLIKLITVLFTVAFLSSCITYTPKDLKISNVTKVDKENLLLTVGETIHHSWIEGEFIVVKLSTKKDLIKYTQKKSYPLNYDANFCEEPDSPLHTFGLYVEKASDTSKLEAILGDNYSNIINTVDFSYLNYYVLIPVYFSKDIEIYGRPERKNAVFYKKYNLTEHPRDLCLKINGSFFGLGFRSNSVVLTHEKIKQIMLEK
ncbi:hypothetical protein [Aliikangiella sp. IMCC44359]|uniref:hypothetical protein n=1 Tax=Aliikangiella sp. IMCC44359 TaxID=3459125 RepID=UPI00403AE169